MAAKTSHMETNRLEAFSDGVFAVAITLLAFTLLVPRPADLHAGHRLLAALLDEWPTYLAYLLSFLIILIMWVNHHALFRLVHHTDHAFLLINGFLLLIITAFPFATNLLATYLQDPADRQVAQLVYSGLSLLMAVTYNRLWAYAARGSRLLDPAADPQLVRNINRQFNFGAPLYLVAFVLAFFSAEASLALTIALALFYALPSTITRVVEARRHPEPA